MKTSKFPLRLNIQHFAEPATPQEPETPELPETPETPEPPEPEKKPKAPEKTFTQQEMERIITDRLARKEEEKQKAVAEAERLAKMNADEKQKYEFDKLQRENEELRAAQNRSLMGKEASRMLAEADIVATEELLNLVVKDDAEQTKEAVTALTELVTGLVDKAVKEKLRGTPPRKPSTTGKVYTKEEIMNITDDFERKRLMAENFHLFKK